MNKKNNKISNGVQKTLKFISSRLLYLVVGIFLAIGATYVYATWDSARTGGSGQLSETNWNELVTMIENNIGGGGGPVWAGYTVATYNGNMGGIKGMNEKCEASYTGSHACRYDEILQLGADYPYTFDAWIIDGGYLVFDYGIAKQMTKDGFVFGQPTSTSNGVPNCRGWTSQADSNDSLGPAIFVNNIDLRGCDESFRIPCCE